MTLEVFELVRPNSSAISPEDRRFFLERQHNNIPSFRQR
jgi:hypothetical protein